MDLKYTVIGKKNKYMKEVLKEEFKISSRLYLKLRNANKIYLNRKLGNSKQRNLY